jgi:hypothetical protein
VDEPVAGSEEAESVLLPDYFVQVSWTLKLLMNVQMALILFLAFSWLYEKDVYIPPQT